MLGDLLASYEPTKGQHIARAPSKVSFVLVTVSSSRFRAMTRGEPVDDPSGDLMEELIRGAGHKVIARVLIPDSEERIEEILNEYGGKVDAIIFSGGTGLARSDITPDVVGRRAEKAIPGFGELFRLLSFEEIGPSAMTSRASAYVVRSTLVFCLPGSPHGVKLALEKLILPEVAHMVYHLRE